mgnify:FL=1
MTKLEKLQAINQRLGKTMFNEPFEISIMMITDYLGKLSKLGLIEAPYVISDMGSRIVAIAEEFGWKVEDGEIMNFCMEMMPGREDAFSFLIKKVRDNQLGTEKN